MSRPDTRGGETLALKDITTNIVIADPVELMRDNPAALIVNKESYGRMAAHFSPAQFDPPQVVLVDAYDSQHGRVRKPFVLDGMTRTKFVADNAATIMEGNPGFRFHYRDVTQSALANPAIVPIAEKTDNQDALTMVQYLRSIIPPTVEHSQIAPDRIAAHLINGWENMVGHELASKYSALAALSLLGTHTINVATDQAFTKDLERQKTLMANETEQERALLETGLIQMAQILRQTRLIRQEVTRSAFMLVSAQSPVIGGQPEAQKQVFGLLHTTEIDRKLAESFEGASEREQQRDLLGKEALSALARAAEKPNARGDAGETGTVIELALKDPALTFDYLMQTLQSDNPVSMYDTARKEINLQNLIRSYREAYALETFSDTEAKLLETFGTRTLLSQQELNVYVSKIMSANKAIEAARQASSDFATNREAYIAQGARPALFEETATQISTLIRAIEGSASDQTLARKTQELAELVTSARRRLNVQMAAYKVGRLVDESSGDKANSQARDAVVFLVLSEFTTLDDQNRVAVSRRIRDLLSLDHDLLASVQRGDIRIGFALSKQRERGTSQSPPSTPQAPVLPYTPAVRVPQVEPSPRRAGRYSTTPEEVERMQQQREEHRKEFNRERLHELMRQIERGLRNIDLVAEDLKDEDKAALDAVIRELGQLAFNHPDTPRVMRETYPRLSREATNRQGVEIERSIENDQKDARTGR